MAHGNTALYDALVSAFDVLRAESAATGGQVFDAHGQSLTDAFAAIRGYQ